MVISTLGGLPIPISCQPPAGTGLQATRSDSGSKRWSPTGERLRSLMRVLKQGVTLTLLLGLGCQVFRNKILLNTMAALPRRTIRFGLPPQTGQARASRYPRFSLS